MPRQPGEETTSLPAERKLTVALDAESSELLDGVCAALGVDEEEAILRSLALLSAEIAKQALLIPTYFDDDDDEEDDDEED
ncbi:MAG: hypothetical protein ACLQVD_14910 [Capsulimonadaceae bacterium]